MSDVPSDEDAPGDVPDDEPDDVPGDEDAPGDEPSDREEPPPVVRSARGVPATSGALAMLLAVILVALAIVLALQEIDLRSSGVETEGGPAPAEVSLVGDDHPPPVAIGPQGRVPQFVVECAFSHRAADDPLVHPGHHGGSHSHDFFGATSVDATSTAADLIDDGGTTCQDRADTAAYWVPTLLRDGEPVDPVTSAAYYRPGPGVPHEQVQPWPPGLTMIAGDAHATDPQPLGVVGWHCGVSDHLHTGPPTCPDTAPLSLRVTFPDCWDGERRSSGDHASHVAYSNDGRCPGSHPVPIVQLVFDVQWPVTGEPDGLALASGGVHSGHADLINAWQPDALERHLEVCINRGHTCRVRSSRTTF